MTPLWACTVMVAGLPLTHSVSPGCSLSGNSAHGTAVSVVALFHLAQSQMADSPCQQGLPSSSRS